VSISGPLRPRQRKPARQTTLTAQGRYCCKGRKSWGKKFSAKGRRARRPSICVLSIALLRSPMSLPSGNEVPRIFARKSRLQPREILISMQKDFCNNIGQKRSSPKLFDDLVSTVEQRGRMLMPSAKHDLRVAAEVETSHGLLVPSKRFDCGLIGCRPPKRGSRLPSFPNRCCRS
jgi:hypothetical protein